MQALRTTGQLILERNSTSVNSVEKDLLSLLSSFGTRQLILQRKPTRMKSVASVFSHPHPSENIKGITVRTLLTSVKSVAGVITHGQTFEDIKQFTLERNHTSVRSVTKPIGMCHPLGNTGDYTLERNPAVMTSLCGNPQQLVQAVCLKHVLISDSFFCNCKCSMKLLLCHNYVHCLSRIWNMGCGIVPVVFPSRVIHASGISPLVCRKVCLRGSRFSPSIWLLNSYW